jgi:LDH2 family malate/lactate/ureidoglycolate dehydrogenase
MELLVERAKKSGVAIASIRNSNHLGALAPYTIYAANNGCIGLITTNASPRMAPTNGSQAMLGNNPWSIATPSPDGPVVMDLANSVAALGKVRLIKARGELLPEGWARDNEGVPTRDPQAAITGLLEPIAGYKGYVMALMIELLTGTLSGGVPSTGVGALTDVSRAGQTSHFFLAISIESLMPEEEFVASAGKLTSDVRNSRLAKGSTEILIPGDIENRISKDRRSAGIPLTDELLDALKTAGSEFNIPLPEWMN